MSQKKDIIVLSDSDDEVSASSSLMTAVKLKQTRLFPKKPKTKRLAANRQQAQLTINSFFQTVTVKDDQDLNARNDGSKKRHSNDGPPKNSSILNISHHSPSSSQATKRSALTGVSPGAKRVTKQKPKFSELKGGELWTALEARRNKQRSLTAKINDAGQLLDNARLSSLDEFESVAITKQVVHSFPAEKCKVSLRLEEPDPEIKPEESTTFPDQTDNSLLETTPIFRPKTNIKIKKKDLEDEEPLTRVLTSTPSKKSTINDSIDLFSDNSELFEEEIKATSGSALCDSYGRHTVVDCSIGDANTVMLLKDMNGLSRTCELQGFWADTPIKVGDIVNILGEFDSNGYICVDMEHSNMIVVNPDYLVSGSVIASSTMCVRRSVLGNRYRGYEAGNRYMLFGSILHEIFQKVLVSDVRTPAEMKKLAVNIAHTPAYAHDMYAIDMQEKTLMEGIEEYMPPMATFLEKHVGAKAKDKIRIAGVRDIEETVWSPRYGMKGKIDVTVDCSRKRGSSDVVPLELKTGRPSSSAEHKGQVTMYSMMLSEKYPGTLAPDNLTPGLLVYLKDGSMQEVTHSSAAVKGLVNLRNELCQGLLQGVCNSNDEFTVEPLPEPINQRRMCESCPHLLTCSLHQRVFGDFTAPPEHIMNTLVPEAIGHLTNLHLEYFTKWSKLLLIEAGTEAKWKTIRDLWTKSVAERVSLGACLSNLSLLEKCKISSNTFQVILTCADTISTKLAAGDIVVVSEADSKVVILTTGSIRRMADHHITLHLDRELVKTKTYCIDKYDCYSSGGAGFTNLARLMEDTAQSAKLRSILIDGRSPAFRTLISCDPEDKLKKITEPLNAKQKKVIKQGLSLQDYLVIHGYPGTGKTSTIVALVEALRCQGMSVLITSYTHSAVDNILLKLKQKGVEFIRLGSASRVHSDIHNYTADHLTKDICTVDELAAFYSQFQVVGTTCLGVAHSMLAKRRFDVCIVDEASQIVQPICLGPLFYASSFILVGDGQQLPPLIKSTHAKLLGMEQTLLDCLGKRHHHAVVELTQQYRMNEVIMSMSNQLTYDNQLECSTEQVKTATLKHVGQELDFSNFGTEDMWIKAVCSPALSDSLVFLNTSGCAPSPSKKYICSSTEASIVCAACQLLIKAGIPADTIGVITPYQAQVQLLKAMLDPTDIEVNTVDQYQGRDKSVIVISFARTSTNTLDHSKKGAGILSDRRRLNVAITRAKHKLILVGNVDTLSSYSPVLKLISLLEPPQVISMPSNWSLSSVF